MDDVPVDAVLPVLNPDEPTYNVADLFQDTDWGVTIAQSLSTGADEEPGLPPSFQNVNAKNLLSYVARCLLIRNQGAVKKATKQKKKQDSRLFVLRKLAEKADMEIGVGTKKKGHKWRGQDLLKQVFSKCYGVLWRSPTSTSAACWKDASPEVKDNWHRLADMNFEVPEACRAHTVEEDSSVQCGGIMLTWHTDWDLEHPHIRRCVDNGMSGEDLAKVLQSYDWLRTKFLSFAEEMTEMSKAAGFEMDGYCAEVCTTTPGRIHLHSFHCGDWKKLPTGCKTLPQVNVERKHFRHGRFLPHMRTLSIERNRHPAQACCLGFYYVLAEKKGHLWSYSKHELFKDTEI